jgi:hypothetical protein
MPARSAVHLSRPRVPRSEAAPRPAHDRSHSAGQPLGAATRATAESTFGLDFSHVRVHADSGAAASARALDARAYTIGPNVVFGAGELRPETGDGRRLLWHELAHIAQQKRSPHPVTDAVSAHDDVHERHASAIVETLERGGSIHALLASTPSQPPPAVQRQPAAQPLRYDRSIKRIPRVPVAQTVDNLEKLLKKKKKDGEITDYDAKGGGKTEYRYLLSVLMSLAEKARWGTEADLVIEIGPVPGGGGAPPLGQVTVRIDAKGVATAELLARGAPAATTTTTQSSLQTTYKLAAVSDDGKAKWSAGDLNDVGEALAMLPGPDKTALHGVELIRVASIPGKPDDAGQFEFPNPVAADEKAVAINPKLRLANSAFDHNNLQFFGGRAKRVPASFQTILHEVGHAIESEVYRTAWRDHAQAIADVKAAGNVTESPKRQKERQEAQDKLKKATTTKEKERLEQRIAQYELDLAMQQEQATDKKAAETKLKDKEKAVMDMDKAGATDRLKKFMDVVRKNKIKPFTDYAGKGDKEFYAEAYSLWLVDREYLSTNHKAIFEFFESGDYRK